MATATRPRSSKASPKAASRASNAPPRVTDANCMVFLVLNNDDGTVYEAELIHIAATAHDARIFSDGFNQAMHWETYHKQVAVPGMPDADYLKGGEA